MSRTVTSGSITFIDTTDNRKLDIYIANNMPTVQIYDPNNQNPYSPDWATNNLTLTASVYLDSIDVTNSEGVSIVWDKQIGTNVVSDIASGKTLTIKDNIPNTNNIITYICRASYKGVDARSQITFTRVDAGLNGAAGADGTSVKILGTAKSVEKQEDNNYYTITYDDGVIKAAAIGDAYIFQGELYVCSVLNGGEDGLTDYFINVGSIQGPPGKDGADAKSIILSGDSQMFKIAKSSTNTTPNTITVNAIPVNITDTNNIAWSYRINNSTSWLNLADGATDIQGGIDRSGNQVVVTGKDLTSTITSITFKASYGSIEDVFTIYKAFDGVDGVKGDSAPTVFLTNENITFSANAQGSITTLTTFTTEVVAYNGTQQVLPTLRTKADGTIDFTDLPTGMTATHTASGQNVAITFTMTDRTLGSTSSNNGAITIPVLTPARADLRLTWSKVNAGAKGEKGNNGTDAYTVMLTNEAHTFAGDVDHAYADSVTTQVLAYKGATEQSVIIQSVGGTTILADDTNYTINGIAGLTFKRSSTEITFTCTESFKNPSGAIPIVILVDGQSFTRMFSYAIAFKGAAGGTGSKGETGAPATSYWLISSASAIQKTSTGTITVTPSQLTFAGKSKTGTNSPVDYACRWIIDYSANGTDYTNLYTSATNESSKSITVATTYKTIRARMYLAGGTTALLDEQIIPVVSDGAKGETGNTGVGVKSVTEYYLATASSSGITSSTTGWTTAIQTITVDKKYLWNYEVITYTDNTTSTTSPIIIGAYGNTGSTGATGKGIKSVTEYYLASTLSTGVTTSTTGWTTTMQTLTATNKYLWNYELITYTDNSTATINPVIIGVYGDKGAQGDRGAGISSVTVTYGTSTSASTQPTSWQTTLPTVAEGSYLWTRTVTDYTDASIADTVTLTYAKQGANGATGSAGTSVTVSSIQYQAGTSATTAPTGTWSNSVVSVAEGSYLWTKTTFSDGKVAYGVAKQGAKGSAGVNAITFQIYAPNGYLLSNELETLTLQTFAYDGNTAITSATYAWSYQENDAWVAISNATTGSLTLTKDDVIKSKTYRCAMTYKNVTYYSTATVQDKTDIYDVMICVSDNINPLTGIYYWVVYALLYSEQGEADALLGPISIDAPTSPASGDYWYAIDTTTQTVTLKKYNGSAWVTSTDKQAYAYDWRQIIDGTQQQAIGNTDKVQIISCNSFTSNATFQCIVTDADGSKLARCNIHLTDTSDPIVSATAPVGVKDGQLWMQTQTDGTFLLYIWDANTSTWKQLNADTKNVVHTTKPSSYKSGDLWVVESDTAITGYTKGTLLQANATTTTFAAAHWTPSLKYESELAEVQNALKSYKQYMSVDSNGLHMQAKNADGTLSPFQALFTNTRLSFYQDDLEVAYISDNKLNIYEANIDVLSVEKKIQLQKFEWAIESNGSMSLIVNY